MIELAPVAERLGGLDLVVIGANEPEAMLRHSRGVPHARAIAVRRRPLPAAGRHGRRPDPAPRRGRRLPVQQRVRGRAAWSRRPAGRRRGARPGRHAGDDRRAATGRSSSAGTARAGAGRRRAAADRLGRPDRRRRRVPGRLPRRAGLGARPRAVRRSSAAMLATYVLETVGPPGVRARRRRSRCAGSPRRSGPTPPTRSTPHLRSAALRCRPDAGPSCPSRRSSRHRARGDSPTGAARRARSGRGRRRPGARHAARGVPGGLVPNAVESPGQRAAGLVVARPRAACCRSDGLLVSRSLRRSLRRYEVAGRHRFRRGGHGVRRPRTPGRMDHAARSARPTAGCTGWAGRTAWRAWRGGRAGRWPVRRGHRRAVRRGVDVLTREPTRPRWRWSSSSRLLPAERPAPAARRPVADAAPGALGVSTCREEYLAGSLRPRRAAPGGVRDPPSWPPARPAAAARRQLVRGGAPARPPARCAPRHAARGRTGQEATRGRE